MELTRFREFSPDVFRDYPLDEWSSSLRSVCGNFQSKPCDGVCRVTGRVHPSTAGGIELVQVANDLAIIQRDLHDIRKDYGEHLFLLLQIEGECGIEQYGRQTIVAPGDCVLVDSSSPSTFHFGGKFSNHLSVHLPRQIFFSDRSTRVDISRRVEADDPMSSILRGLVAKLMKTNSSDKRAPELRQSSAPRNSRRCRRRQPHNPDRLRWPVENKRVLSVLLPRFFDSNNTGLADRLHRQLD